MVAAAPVSKKDVVVIALSAAGGAENIVDTEHIAKLAHSIAPEAFRWRLYGDQIDLDMVRTTLRHAAEDKAARLEGSLRTGWNLTPSGVEWVRSNATAVVDNAKRLAPTIATATRNDEAADRRELARLRALPAYARHQRGSALTAVDAGDVFRVDLYTPERQRHMKVARIQSISAIDPALADFTAAAAALVEGIETSKATDSPARGKVRS